MSMSTLGGRARPQTDGPLFAGAFPLLPIYTAVVAAGHSVLVRPATAYEGLDQVIAQVAEMSDRPTLVTDLDTVADLVPAGRPFEAGGDGAGALTAFHTSGSTGSPKCVIYKRSTVNRHARTIAQVLGLTSESAYVALPPARFAYGLSIVNSHLEAGVPVTFSTGDWGLGDVHDLAATSSGLSIYLLPQHVPLLLSSGIESEKVHRLIFAGGRLSQSAADSLARHFPAARLTNMYGQAELGPRLSVWDGPIADFREGDVGSPLPGVDLDIRPDDSDDADVTAGIVGENAEGAPGAIHARTEFGMWRYLPPPYAEPLPGPGPSDYVRTGDLGATTPGGGIRHQGRADHWLNVAGTKLDVRVVTRLLQETFHPVALRVSARPARVGGDLRPVIQLVPGADREYPRVADVRRALHAEIGALTGLCDISIVEHLDLGESGK